MKKVKLIEEIISKKQAEKKELVVKRQKIELDKRVDLTEAMEYFFPEILNDSTHIEISDNYIYFKRKHEDYTYPKDVLNLCLRGKSWRDEEINRIETSFYSTTDDSKFELERMILLGNVAKILLDYSDDIIANWNCVVKKYKDILLDAHKKVWSKEKEISELDQQVAAIKKAAEEKDLFENGIKFGKRENYHDRVNLNVRWDWTIYGINEVKVTRVTPSGKSYDLDLKVNRQRWNDKTNGYEDFIEEMKVKSVRAGNVWNMIRMNQDVIKS